MFSASKGLNFAGVLCVSRVLHVGYTRRAAVGHIRKVNVHRAHTFGLHVAFLGVRLKLENVSLTDSERSGLKWSKLQKGRRFVRFFSLGFPKSIFAYLSNFGHLDFTFRKQNYVCNKSFYEYAL